MIYHTFDLERGSGSISMVDGSLTYTQEIIPSNTNTMSISVSLQYDNNNASINKGYGYGFDIILSPKYDAANLSDFYKGIVKVILNGTTFESIKDLKTNDEIKFDFLNNQLYKIIDTQGEETKFEYTSNKTTKITSPDGESVLIGYSGNLITKIIAPNRTGVELTYSNNKVSNIKNLLLVDIVRENVILPDITDAELLTVQTTPVDETNFAHETNKITKTNVKTEKKVAYDITSVSISAAGALVTKINEKTIVSNSNSITGHSLVEHADGSTSQYSQVLSFGGFYHLSNYAGAGRDMDVFGRLKNESSTELINTSNTPAVEPSLKKEIKHNLTYDGNNIKTDTTSISIWNDIYSGKHYKSDTFTTNYEYDSNDKLSKVFDTARLVKYDLFGLGTPINVNGIIQERISIDPNASIEEWATYHPDAPNRRLYKKIKTDRGRVTEQYSELYPTQKIVIEYAEGTNIVKSVIDTEGNTTLLGINKSTYGINSISAENNQTDIVNTKDYLTRLSSGRSKPVYNFEYSNYSKNNLKQDINVDCKTYASTTQWIKNGCDITTTAYASGEQTETIKDKANSKAYLDFYDKKGNKQRLATQTYGPWGDLKTSIDHTTGEITNVLCNFYDPNLKFLNSESDHLKKILNTDTLGHTSATYYLKDLNITQAPAYSYDEYDRISKMGNDSIFYDKLGRITQIGMIFYTYKDSPLTFINNGQTYNYTTNYISEIRSGSQTLFSYDYDSRGNIKEYSTGGYTTEYGYDALNRLVLENNEKLGKSFEYTYDDNGNILSKQIYDYTSNNLTGGEKISYTYDGDKLVEYGKEQCEYDELGRPEVYRDRLCTWDRVKNLASMRLAKCVKNEQLFLGDDLCVGDNVFMQAKYKPTAGDLVEFEYNASGLRVKKSVNSSNGVSSSKYYWADDKLLAETRTTGSNLHLPIDDDDVAHQISKTDILYTYGPTGISGFMVRTDNGAWITYTYRKNLQGDITHILSGSTVVAEYVYDAWGNHKIVTNTNGIADFNAVRYRGYYFDTEIELYYLKSRYYDPETGRFISPDDISILNKAKYIVNGLNLYSYCLNNPIKYTDKAGQWWLVDWIQALAKAIVVPVVKGITYAVADTIKFLYNDMAGTALDIIKFSINDPKDLISAAQEALGNSLDLAMTIPGVGEIILTLFGITTVISLFLSI